MLTETDHEHLGAAVEGVDNHLPLNRASDLHPPVSDGGWGGAAGPLSLANRLRGGVETGKLSSIIARLLLLPALQDILDPRPELSLQLSYKLKSIPSENLLKFRPHGSANAHSRGDRHLRVP